MSKYGFNTDVTVEDGDLVIRIPLDVNPSPSKSGKSLVIGSTRGNAEITDTPIGTIRLGVNCYQYETERQGADA